MRHPLRKPLRRDAAALRGEGEHRDEVRSYIEKAPENRRFDRLRPAKTALVAGGVVRTLWCVTSGQPPGVTLPALLALLSAVIGLDPAQAFRRVLATPSRVVVASSLLAWAIFARLPNKQTALVAIIVTVCAGIMVGMLNTTWLASETYRRTDRVREAMQDVHEKTVEDMWDRYGSAEVTAVAYDMGAVIRDDIERQVRKACWILGLITGLRSIRQAVKDRDDAQRERDGLQIQVATLQAQIDAVRDYIQLMEEDKTECITLRQKLSDEVRWATTLRIQNGDFERELTKTKAELEETKAKLANLIRARQQQALPEPEPEPEVPDEPTEDDIMDWLCTRIPGVGEFPGIKRTMNEFGLSEWNVRSFIKTHKAEIDERRKEA